MRLAAMLPKRATNASLLVPLARKDGTFLAASLAFFTVLATARGARTFGRREH